MRFNSRASLFLLMSVGMLLISEAARASDIYIAQSAAGTGNGGDCTNAEAVSFFNTSGNWGGGSGQIGPGTTVHLCGTFTGSAGSTMLTFQGNGSAGSPITLVFEAGAALNAPYWGSNSGSIYSAAINVVSKSYIVINGQNTGSISATANGTNLAHQSNSAGVYVSGGANVTVENLAISNMYVHVANSSTSGGNASNVSAGIQMDKSNNFAATGNTIHDAVNGVFMGYTSASIGYTVSGNTIYNCNWGIAAGDDGPNSSLTQANIYGNTIHDAANWDDTNDDYHHNGIYIWAVQGSSNVEAPNIYNNYIYGNMSQCSPNSCATGWISLLIGGNPAGMFTSPSIFNNVLVSNVANSYSGNGFITVGGSNALIANNTIVGYNNAYGLGIDYGPQIGATVYNNIVEGLNYWIIVNVGSSFASSNNNNFFNLNNGFQYEGKGYGNLLAWQQGTGFDARTIVSNPTLTSSYRPSPGSPVIGAAANLHSACAGQPTPGLGALCYDVSGVARPAAGGWDIGAYANSSAPAVPAAPTGLTATAQ